MLDVPLTLFLPGAGADPTFWRAVGQRLPAEWPKQYLAWPGLGDQPHSPDVQGWRDLVALTESHLPEGPVHLVAQSFGGAIAMSVALRHPARVRRLVLTASGAGLTSRVGDWRVPYRAEYPRAAEWIYTAETGLEGQLSAIETKTLLLWGDADPISPVSVGQYLESRLPNAHLYVVSGGTHALGAECADEVAPLIEQFLRD